MEPLRCLTLGCADPVNRGVSAVTIGGSRSGSGLLCRTGCCFKVCRQKIICCNVSPVACKLEYNGE